MLIEIKCNEQLGFQLLGTSYVCFTHQMPRRCRSPFNYTSSEFYMLSGRTAKPLKQYALSLRTWNHAYVCQVYKDLGVEVIFMSELFMNIFRYFQINCELTPVSETSAMKVFREQLVQFLHCT